MSSRCSSPNCRRPPPPPPQTRQACPVWFLDEPPPLLHRCSLPSLAPLALHETHTHTLPLRLLVTEPVSFPTPTVLCILDAALDLNLHPLVFCPSVSSCLASPLRHHTAPISCSSANPTGALCFFSSSSRFVSKPTARLPRRLVATLSLPPPVSLALGLATNCIGYISPSPDSYICISQSLVGHASCYRRASFAACLVSSPSLISALSCLSSTQSPSLVLYLPPLGVLCRNLLLASVAFLIEKHMYGYQRITLCLASCRGLLSLDNTNDSCC